MQPIEINDYKIPKESRSDYIKLVVSINNRIRDFGDELWLLEREMNILGEDDFVGFKNRGITTRIAEDETELREKQLEQLRLKNEKNDEELYMDTRVNSVNDKINHPDHYTWHPVCECKDIVGEFNYHIGTAIAYLWRAGKKDSESLLDDLRKSRKHIDFEIERLTEKGGM